MFAKKEERKKAAATPAAPPSLVNHSPAQNAARAPLQTPAPLRPVLTPTTAEQALDRLIKKATESRDGPAMSAIVDTLNGLRDRQGLRATARLYQQHTGRSLHNDLQEALRPWLDARRDVTELLTELGPALGRQALVEQCAYAAYSNKPDLSDAKGGDGTTNLAALIRGAGYRIGPLIRGRWGLQWREFIPGEDAEHADPIMAYRGTEGIRAPWNNPLKPSTREGMVDTYIGDATRMGAGYPQFEANRALIERRASALGKSIMTGHSLGGGLAQIVTAKLPKYAAECITFAAPGITEKDAESLEQKDIPTTHHRTEGDVVPMGNSKAAPGTIVTYERYERAQNDSGWLQSQNPGTNHNNMPVRGALNYQQPGNVSPLERQVLDKGASGPTGSDHADKTISVVSAVIPTTQDPVRHIGERDAAVGITRKVFYDNLSYNLIAERAQKEVLKLNPRTVHKSEIRLGIQRAARRIVETERLEVSDQAFALYKAMGIPDWEISKGLTPGIRAGQEITIRREDRLAVAEQIFDLWNAWWSGR